MTIPPNITRRALLGLASAFALLPLAGCDTAADADATHAADERPLEEGELLVPSDHSPVAANNAWCAAFQICWNMLEENFNDGNPIPEAGNPQMVADLNCASFTADHLGEDHYVTYVGRATTQAKTEIEQLIDERFDQTSDVLDLVKWNDDPNTLLFILYCMLYREFTFAHVFDVLDPALFGSEENGNLTENVAYFGAESGSDALDQVLPLFWDAEDRFAVQIECNEGDILVLARGAEGSTFDEMWNDVQASINPDFRMEMGLITSFACPKLNVDVLTSYDELEGVGFTGSAGHPWEIKQALQTLRFRLDETGGSIKSEAAIVVGYGGGPMYLPHDYRFDDSFVLFLVDGNVTTEYPYAAINITDINDFIR